MIFNSGDLVRIKEPHMINMPEDSRMPDGPYADLYHKFYKESTILRVIDKPERLGKRLGVPGIVYIQIPQELSWHNAPWMGLREWDLELVFDGHG